VSRSGRYAPVVLFPLLTTELMLGRNRPHEAAADHGGSRVNTKQAGALMMFEVMLEARLHGAPSHLTRDVIEGAHAEAAEVSAIAAWRKADPRYTYAPLLTVQVQQCRCGRI
jgi:hypothetical protein